MSHITVKPNGQVMFMYSDDLRSLLTIGASTIRRASHVEPTDDGHWTADMQPSGGPLLGPFEERAEALRAEVEWIQEHIL